MTEEAAKPTPAPIKGWTTYSMYGGKVTLGFDQFGKRTGRKHSYWLKVPRSEKFPNGMRLIPGVTGISGLLTEAASGLSPWAARLAVESLKAAGHKITDDQAFEAVNAHITKRDFAAVRGTEVHELIERRIKGMELPPDATPLAVSYADSVVKKLEKEKIKVIACELKIFSLEHGYAGTTDLIVEFADGTRGVLDVKTSKAFRVSHAMQIAAYSFALEEEFPDKPKFADAGAILAAKTSKIHLLSDAMNMPGREALERCHNAYLGLLAVRTSIPNIKDFGRTY